MSYARVVEIDSVDGSKRDEAIQAIRERVIPFLQEHDGFGGVISLFDPDHGRAFNVQLWDTREHAEEAERQIAPLRAQLTRELGVIVRTSTLYEAPIVEVTGAVRA